MQRACIVVALLLWGGVSLGSELPADLAPSRPARPTPSGAYQGGGRTGGDTIADAVIIPSLPFTATGNTCGFADDYDEVCPYVSSTAPDVVYSYFEPSGSQVSVDLCGSSYDTKVYIYEDTQGNVVACNDDQCGPDGLQSEIYRIALNAGHTYYFVVDGYGLGCGDYTLSIAPLPPCVVDCPPGAQEEGEPPCVDGYYDDYNGGCGGLGWTAITAQDGDCGVMCSRSCTYLHNGNSYRDTDWYEATAAGGPVTVTGTAEFPLRVILFYYVANCADYRYISATGAPCEPVTLSWPSMEPGQRCWLWAAPDVFSGVPESNYTLDVCGIATVPVGACCHTHYCFLVAEPSCTGTFLGPGTDCNPNPCVADPTAACCLADGTCEMLTADDCAQAQGVWAGAGFDCDSNPCQLLGACCYLSGNCRYGTLLDCRGGQWLGAGTSCAPNPCETTDVTPEPEVKVSTWGGIKSLYRAATR